MQKDIGIPIYNGPFNPFQVLWSPNILLPSRKYFPPSIGFPPPVITIEAFEMYAGTMIRRLNINNAIQSAQLNRNVIIRKLAKIRHAKVIVKIIAIFLWFFSVSKRLVSDGKSHKFLNKSVFLLLK